MNLIKSVTCKLKNFIFTMCTRFRFVFMDKRVSIISQSCAGGVIYHRLGLPFLSPTIDVYIEGKDFLKLINNLRHYMTIDPEEDRPLSNRKRFPVMRLEDIRIFCMHYGSFDQARNAWQRRKGRLNYDKIIVLADSWNCQQDEAIISSILSAGFPCVLISDMSIHKDLPNCLYLGKKYKVAMGAFPEPNPLGISKDLYRRNFERDFDLYGTVKRSFRATKSKANRCHPS